MKKKKIVGKAVRVFLVLALAGCLVLFLVNLYIIRKEEKYIVSAEEAEAFQDVDCIMVLGCGVRPDGSPSGMLNDRLVQGVSLYKEDVSDRLLMSGDHGRVNYDEVNLMKQFAIDRGVPSENIFMDPALPYVPRPVRGPGHGHGGLRRGLGPQDLRRPEDAGPAGTAGPSKGHALYHRDAQAHLSWGCDSCQRRRQCDQ